MSKARALGEIVLVTALILAAIWFAPLWPERVTANRLGWTFALAALAVTVVSPILQRESLREIGLRFDNFLRVLGWVAVPTIGLVAVLLMAGYEFNSLHFGAQVFRFRWAKILWPLIQEYLFQAFLNRRLQVVFGKGNASVVGAAAIFAGLHSPNPVLMLATFVAGSLWAKIYQREPNLFALAISHAILALVLGHSLPKAVLPNMRVGWSFWR